ncbi:hypothetical protein [Ramlibacter henchirensis]|uniref:hypothetical protein n=1 Tax=Ramlibacter henchirensis TaxID=204072 RepID=UPI00142F4ED1|nr:hypothetical protein [Ramlibacter henchirensis]
MKAAWVAYDKGGPAPSESLIAQVSRARAIANDRLTMAVLALGAASRRDKA